MPSRYIAVGTTWREVVKNWVGVSGVWRQVQKKWIGSGGVWRLIYQALEPFTSVTLDKSNVLGFCSYFAPMTSCTATTTSVTATPVGGEGHTYQWEKVSGTTFTITSPTNATTAFKRTASTSGVGTYRCKVTDSLGVIKYSPNVTVSTDHGSIQ